MDELFVKHKLINEKMIDEKTKKEMRTGKKEK